MQPVRRKSSLEDPVTIASATRRSSSSTTTTTTTSSSDSEDLSRDSEEIDEEDASDDDEFVDAPEASGTLISRFLNQTERLVTAVNSISAREDLTKTPNWGGSPAYETPPMVGAAESGASAPAASLSAVGDRVDGGSSKSSTLRSATDRARQHKLNETRRRLIQGEEDDDDDDDEDEEIGIAFDDGDDPGKLTLASAPAGTRSSHSSNSPSQTSRSSYGGDGASLGKQSTSATSATASTTNPLGHPFKVVEEQDNISISRHTATRGGGSGLTPAQSFEGPSPAYVGPGRVNATNAPDLISSCNEPSVSIGNIELEMPCSSKSSKSKQMPSPPFRRSDNNDSPTTPTPTPVASSSKSNAGTAADPNGAPISPPVPPPRRKKKRQAPQPQQPNSSSSNSNSASSQLQPPGSRSPTVSIRSHVMTGADAVAGRTPSSSLMYYSTEGGASSSASGGKLVVTAQDEEKTRAKSAGPRVLRRTESIGLVETSSASTTTTDKEKSEGVAVADEVDSPRLNTNSAGGGSAVGKSSSLRMGKGAGGHHHGHGHHGRVGKKSSGPGSYSLPGPHLGGVGSGSRVSSEIKKHSLPILRSKTTDAGKPLSDLEILEQVTVLNLDTGERIPLSSAEDRIPKCVNPLSLHIMRLTSEYVSEEKQGMDSDDDNSSSRVSTTTSDGFKRKRTQLKKLIGNVGRSAISKAKSIKAAAASLRTKSVDDGDSEPSSSLPLPPERPPMYPAMHQQHQRQNVPPSSLKFGASSYLAPPQQADAASVIGSSTNTLTLDQQGPTILKMKASPKHKGPYDFENLELVQELTKAPEATNPNTNTIPSTPTTTATNTSGGAPPNAPNTPGPIWCMKFSNCGRLLAAAGQERLIKVFVLKSQLNYFVDLVKSSKVSPTPSVESVGPGDGASFGQFGGTGAGGMGGAGGAEGSDPWPFVPLSSYAGHTADLLDIAWSKSFFLLSSSMDRTVRLWHISRKECLCTFQHVDFVTAIAFHPRDDRYFLSGSLDSKVRIWNIPDKKVALWNEVPGPNNLITTANFCQNGKFAVVGTYDGRVIFYHTEQLKYHTQIILNKKKCVKISGIEPMPGEDKILVTSNDSRIRLFDLRDLSLNCKYTGSVTRSSQIKASFSHDGKFIISGSENNFIYLWRTAHEFVGFRGGARRDRNKYWEGVRVHNAVVTCAIFAPHPDLIIKEMIAATDNNSSEPTTGSTRHANDSSSTSGGAANSSRSNYSQLGYVIASADFMGQIKICICRVKPKCSSLPVSAIA